MKKFYDRYKHAIPLIIYGIIYLTWFTYLEKHVTRPANLIHMSLDDVIPFCEFFVVPYFLWFFYVSAVVVYFFFKDKQDYFRSCVFLFTGMTIFLIHTLAKWSPPAPCRNAEGQYFYPAGCVPVSYRYTNQSVAKYPRV